MTSLLTTALEWQSAGTSIVPTRGDGSKAPDALWKAYQTTPASPTQINRWFAPGGHQGYGVICGNVSGNLEMLEVEGRALHQLPNLTEALADNGLTDVWTAIDNGCIEATPGTGIHWHYKVSGGPAKPNTKLASRPATKKELEANPDDKVKVLWETRGEGGFTILAPSNGTTHPSGKPWVRMGGGPDTIPTITVTQRDTLHAIITALFDQMPPANPPTPTSTRRYNDNGLTPGDDYSQRGSWNELLTKHGWTRGRTIGDNTCWVRPGKNLREGISATTRHMATGHWLYVFTTSSVFEAGKPYSLFAAYGLLEHAGNYSAAARQLKREGYGDNDPFQASSAAFNGLPPAPGTPTPAATVSPLETLTDPADDPEQRSWRPVNLNLILDGSWEPQEPTIGARRDGIGMFYPGKRHTVSSESEAGKTWFMLAAAQHEITVGNHVLYLDFEDDAGPLVGRLMTLGVKTDHIREYFHYIRPEERIGAGYGYQDVDEALERYQPTLAIVDGVTEAMTLHGLDPLSNVDAATFGRLLPKRLSDAGSATVSLDHVPKAADNRGRYSIGAVHKLNGLDGAAYVLDARTPFGVGMEGTSTVRIAKDRPGQLRKHSLPSAGGLHWFADLVLTSVSAKVAEIQVAAPTEKSEDWRPTIYMERISEALQERGPLSGKMLEAAVSGKATTIRQALNCLILDGYVTEKTPHTLLRAFTEMSDLL